MTKQEMSKMREYMIQEAEYHRDHRTLEYCATSMAEDAAMQYDCPIDDDGEVPDEVYDLAVEVIDELNDGQMFSHHRRGAMKSYLVAANCNDHNQVLTVLKANNIQLSHGEKSWHAHPHRCMFEVRSATLDQWGIKAVLRTAGVDRIYCESYAEFLMNSKVAQ